MSRFARELATEAGELPEGPALETLLDAAAGLTRYEAENAYSLSLVREARLVPESIWELKSGMLRSLVSCSCIALAKPSIGLEALSR